MKSGAAPLPQSRGWNGKQLSSVLGGSSTTLIYRGGEVEKAPGVLCPSSWPQFPHVGNKAMNLLELGGPSVSDALWQDERRKGEGRKT